VNFLGHLVRTLQTEIPWMIEFNKSTPARFYDPGSFDGRGGQEGDRSFLEKERFDVNGQKEAMNYPILLGNDSISEKFGGIIGLPTSMLFTRDGKKVRTIVGLVNHDEIAKVIEVCCRSIFCFGTKAAVRLAPCSLQILRESFS